MRQFLFLVHVLRYLLFRLLFWRVYEGLCDVVPCAAKRSSTDGPTAR